MANQTSRFNNTDSILFNGANTYGPWNVPSFIKNRPSSDRIGSVVINSTRAGRPDLLSNDIYGTPQYAWVLLAFNNVKNTLNWPSVNSLVEYPSESVIASEVLG